MTINGMPLTIGQSMTVRNAIECFASFLTEDGLGDDETGNAMTQSYLDRIGEIRRMMGL